MDTICTQLVYAPDRDVLVQNERILQSLENELAKTREQSEIYALNHAQGDDVRLSDSTAGLLTYAKSAAQTTGGAFNPTLGLVMDAWGFSATPHVPDPAVLSDLLVQSDYEEITVSGQTANIGATNLDLGGIAKGYALDRIATNLEDQKIESALISLGGSIYAKGKKPDGSAYLIGLRDPAGTANDYFATLMVDGNFISTSGIYERGFTQDGTYYHHIIDPKTGYPVQNNLLSVSVVCASGIDSDIYSTALFVMGLKDGLIFAEAAGLDAVFVTNEKKVYTTDHFAKSFGFTITNEAYRHENA